MYISSFKIFICLLYLNLDELRIDIAESEEEYPIILRDQKFTFYVSPIIDEDEDN